ncbi:hypothetical protein D3C79_771300 [compost metagenome]
MNPKIRSIISNEAPSINSTINLTEVNRDINDHILQLHSKINITDLENWCILVSITIRNTDNIGIFKRIIRYPLDREFELSISIPVPGTEEALYGLPKNDCGFFLPLTDNKFHIITPQFFQYKNLHTYIVSSIKIAINKAFEIGFTCHGKKIHSLSDGKI